MPSSASAPPWRLVWRLGLPFRRVSQSESRAFLLHRTEQVPFYTALFILAFANFLLHRTEQVPFYTALFILAFANFLLYRTEQVPFYMCLFILAFAEFTTILPPAGEGDLQTPTGSR